MLNQSVSEPGKSRLSYFNATAILWTLIASIFSCIWLWRFVCDYPDPSGANGYFYLKQTETLAGGLGFYFKDYSLSFLIPVALMKVVGNSLDAFRLSTVLVFFSMSCGVAFLTHQLTRGLRDWERCLAVVASVAAVCSCTVIYEFNLTFFKNACAICFLIWAAGFALSDLSCGLLLGGVFFVAAMLSHKSVFIVFALALIARAFQLKNRKQLLWILGLASAAAVAFLFLFNRAWAHVQAMLTDFTNPHAWESWIQWLPHGNFELFLTVVGLGFAVVVGLATRQRLSSRQKIYVDAIVLLNFLALQPFQVPGPNGPFYRFILMSVALTIPLIMAGLARVKFGCWLGVVLLLPFFAQPALSSHEIDEVFTPWDVIREDVLKIKNYVRPEDHLTSHHGFEFFIDYVTGIRSRSFLSDHPEQRDFRVAYVAFKWLRNEEEIEDLQKHALLQIGAEYLLFTEQEWQAMKVKWKIPQHWKNPQTHRPDFISE